MKFALSKNKAQMVPIGKSTKIFKHAECGKEMEKVKDGQYFCRYCLKTGFPVKAL